MHHYVPTKHGLKLRPDDLDWGLVLDHRFGYHQEQTIFYCGLQKGMSMPELHADEVPRACNSPVFSQ